MDRLPLRIRQKIETDLQTGCWVWFGCAAPNGYGHVSFEGKARIAHRVVYELVRGAIPAGLVLHHKCRNRRCVNPEHLQAVSQRDNLLLDQTPFMRCGLQTCCVRGHRLRGKNVEVRRRRGNRTRVCIVCRRLRDRMVYAPKKKADAVERAKHNARKKLHYALKVGNACKKRCEECGAVKVEAHHTDYSKPLSVVWLCSKHHHALHR